MEVNSAKSNVKLNQDINVGDRIMVAKTSSTAWKIGEKFKVKKIHKEVYGTFLYNSRGQNIDINNVVLCGK